MLGGSGLLGHAGGVVRYTADKDAGIITAYVEKMRDGADDFSKGFHVRKLNYVKHHKRTGEPITIELPVVERIPVGQWAAMLAAKKAAPGVRAVVDPSVPAGLDDFGQRVFQVLRQLDTGDRAAGRPSQERWLKDVVHALHPQKAGEAFEDYERTLKAAERRLQRRLAGCEEGRGPFYELAVKRDGLVQREPYRLLLPEQYRTSPLEG